MAQTQQLQEQPPVLRFQEGSTVVPGDRLGTIRQVRPGIGTSIKGGHIYASLLGILTLQRLSDEPPMEETTTATSSSSSSGTQPRYFCHVRSSKPPATNQVLRVGQKIVGRISRITPQNALVEIRVAEGVGPLRQPYYEGAIRLEDIRSFSKEKQSGEDQNAAIPLVDSFRPGDLVACRVISLGDSRRYFLTTAETELGVIKAERRGIPMIPVSWKEMECPETGVREPRKVAKPLMAKE